MNITLDEVRATISKFTISTSEDGARFVKIFPKIYSVLNTKEYDELRFYQCPIKIPTLVWVKSSTKIIQVLKSGVYHKSPQYTKWSEELYELISRLVYSNAVNSNSSLDDIIDSIYILVDLGERGNYEPFFIADLTTDFSDLFSIFFPIGVKDGDFILTHGVKKTEDKEVETVFLLAQDDSNAGFLTNFLINSDAFTYNNALLDHGMKFAYYLLALDNYGKPTKLTVYQANNLFTVCKAHKRDTVDLPKIMKTKKVGEGKLQKFLEKTLIVSRPEIPVVEDVSFLSLSDIINNGLPSNLEEEKTYPLNFDMQLTYFSGFTVTTASFYPKSALIFIKLACELSNETIRTLEGQLTEDLGYNVIIN